jgi:hypothetical protein
MRDLSSKTLSAALTTFVVGAWFRTGTMGAYSIFNFMDSATPTTEHCSVRYTATGAITFTRNGTVLATSTNLMALDTWYHIEAKVTIGDTTGDAGTYGKYEVRVNGSSVNWIPAAVDADTRNGGNASIGSLRLGLGANSASLSNRFQDFYILDLTGASANDFLGPCRFAVLRPVGIGTTAEWTGNYADNFVNVADAAADGDYTFNQSSTAGQTDQFAMKDITAGTVHALQTVLMARQDAGVARTVRSIIRIDGTDYTGVSFALTSTYAAYCDPLSVSPDTSAAWDDAEVNAAEFGYELVS